MLRLLLGLVKGAAVGGAIGFGAYSAGMSGGLHWLTYGLVGACVGLLVGRPVWSHLLDKDSTVVVAVLKAIVGYGFGVGVYAIVAKAWGGFDLTISHESRAIFDWQYIFGALVGGLYGAWVELDDAPAADASGGK